MGVNFKRSVAIGFVVAFVFLGLVLIWVKGDNGLILQSSLAVANLVMAGVVALQAIATAESAEQVKRQAELMNESLLEMKKQRMNIEEFKNSLITYLRYVNGILTSNSTYASYHRIQEPYQYLIDGYHKRIGANLSPSEVGLLWRISIFIRRFLEMRSFSWQELDKYHDLIHRLKDSSTPRDEKPKLANEIREKSKELGKIIENIIQEIEEMGNQKFEEEILRILES